MGDFCYKCKFRNDCIPVILYQEQIIKKCSNYSYDNEFYDMKCDFKIETLNIKRSGDLILVVSKDYSISNVVPLSPELEIFMEGENEIYAKGYIDRNKSLQLLRRIEPICKW